MECIFDHLMKGQCKKYLLSKEILVGMAYMYEDVSFKTPFFQEIYFWEIK